MNEKTFIILKPDAIERGLVGKIISRFEDKGFKIKRIEQRWKNKDWCRLHYVELDDNIFDRILPFMTSTPIIGVILEGTEVIRAIKRVVGSLDAEPGTIRGDYTGFPIHENLVHASNNDYEVDREIELFFDSKIDYDPDYKVLDDKQQENHCYGS